VTRARELARAARRCVLAAVCLVALLRSVPSFGQLGGALPAPAELVRIETPAATIAPGGAGSAVVRLHVLAGWHVNANPPSSEYLIPTEAKLSTAVGITPGVPRYPEPRRLKLSFEEQPLAVYDGDVEVLVPLVAARDAALGTRTLTGIVRFQACNDQVCLAPAELPLTVEVTVAGSVPPGSATAPGPAAGAGSAPVPGSGFVTGPPTGPSGLPPGLTGNPIARAFARNSLAAFLSLFLIGLALNLTPCVYPMLGVTVSIFGARRAAPPLQVFGLALLYVLGIAAMYSTLGLIAAFTGGLFGGFLQSPLVLVAIGFLLVALSLSMFGLYELQFSPELLTRLGGSGTTGAAGVFASGLVVGIFAAPCIGPPVVALLALVGAKGDPWFGFVSFFVLSLGLGAPYLVLGTFSNLLHRLPRSGDWMVWVKKGFGVILAGVGLFYVLLAAAPRWAIWVLPAALIVGGLYLGLFERSGVARPAFTRIKWATGALAVALGVLFVAATARPTIAFRSFDGPALHAGLRAGKPAMIDFSADWCVPCHELESRTFTDAGVIEAAQAFLAYRVDLTRFNTPQAEHLRKQYRINGVPTVIFLALDGREIESTRVEGFVPPRPFLERMRFAREAAAVR